MSASSNTSLNSISTQYLINNSNQQSTLTSTLINTNVNNITNNYSFTNSQSNTLNSNNVNGINSITYMDDLVKEYLLYRGCNSTLKSFEHDLKQDKDRTFKADKIVEQLFIYINTYDLINLIEYWSYLDQKYFSHLTFKTLNGTSLSRKYELFLFRYYLIHAIQTNKIDKCNEFLDKLAPFIQTQPEWKDWFSLPFIKNPEENHIFSVYFNQKWIDTFMVSLQNFISIVFQTVQFPRLLIYDEDAYWNMNSVGKNPSVSIQFNESAEFLNQELTDEFQLMQTIDTTSANTLQSSNANSSTFISLLKNLGSSNTKQKATPNSNQQATPITNINTQQQQQQQQLTVSITPTSQNKSSPVLSPLENLVKASKLAAVTPINNESTKTLIQAGEINSSIVTTTSPVITSPVKKDETTNEIQRQNANLIVDTNILKPQLATDPYTVLSEEDYLEHRAAVTHCKHSSDGNYVASIDISGAIKIWTINETTETISTLIQKSTIISMEWDKRNSNILYFGNNQSSLKSYDINEKKILQELIINRQYPYVNQICSLPINDKLLVILSSENGNSKFGNGQLILCKVNNLTSMITVEKTIDLESYYSQCLLPYLSNYVLLGCTDGYIRVFDCNLNDIINSRKCHLNNVVNVAINKGQTKLYSLSNDNYIKIWLLNNTFLHSSNTQNPINTYKLPFDLQSTKNQILNSNPYSLMSLDLRENLIFIANNEGILLYKLLNNLSKLNKINSTNDSTVLQNAINNDYNGLEQIELFSCENVTTIELWNSTYSCILLAGCSNGKIHLYRLLNH